MNRLDYQNASGISATSTQESLPQNEQPYSDFIDYDEILRPSEEFDQDNFISNRLQDLWRQDNENIGDIQELRLNYEDNEKITHSELPMEYSKVAPQSPIKPQVQYEMIQSEAQVVEVSRNKGDLRISKQYLGDSQTKKDNTAICKIIFTQFKKCLKNSCPINMTPYFDICRYDVNHRTLFDFEVPIWYVEKLDQKNPQLGLLKQFKEFAVKIKPLLLNHAQISFSKDGCDKRQKYQSYIERIYDAYLYGRSSLQRIRKLYGGSNTPKAIKKLEAKLEKFVF